MSEIISLEFSRSGYVASLYDSGVTGSSDCNSYIPFFSLFAHELLTFEEGEVTVVEYSLPTGYIRQYTELKLLLLNADAPKRYLYRISGVESHLDLHRGLLYRDNIIYMCLALESDYVLNTPMEEIKAKPDTTRFTLFINNEFEDVPEFRNVLKNLQTNYIGPLKQEGVDVVYTSRIMDWVFKNNYIQPKFRNVAEMLKHLKEEVPLMI